MMTVLDLKMKLHSLLPFKGKKDQYFPERLKYCLDLYQSWIKELEILGSPVSQDTIIVINLICNKLNHIVENVMKGLPSTAFIQLNQLLNIDKEDSLIDIKSTLKKINIDKSFYRIRIMDSVNDLRDTDLFHIPLAMRGIVKTQRYSTPGYPCLYLGESIYGCWEELNRPPMHLCAVSRFSNRLPLKLIDLTLPSIDDLVKESYLRLLPLILACMIKVSDPKATFKPEYIVPQLLIEWILKNRKKYKEQDYNYIHGVVYYSTHANFEFEFPEDKFINYAVPIFDINPKYKYCQKLCRYFELTKPTTNEIEKLKGSYHPGIFKMDLDPIEKLMQNYKFSEFGQLEERLNNIFKFPLNQISNC